MLGGRDALRLFEHLGKYPVVPVAVLQVQGFYLIPAVFLAPIIPQMGFYGLKHKAFSIIQDTLTILSLVVAYCTLFGRVLHF